VLQTKGLPFAEACGYEPPVRFVQFNGEDPLRHLQEPPPSPSGRKPACVGCGHGRKHEQWQALAEKLGKFAELFASSGGREIQRLDPLGHRGRQGKAAHIAKLKARERKAHL
jgi:hypothetical protein